MRYLTLFAAFVMAASSAHASVFEGEEKLQNSELADLRGGYLLAGNLIIDFSIIRQTLINGELKTMSFFSSNGAPLQGDSLQSLIQLGGRNFDLSALENAAAFTSIIQNNLDNSTIQHMQVVDVMVQNMQAMRNERALTPLTDMMEFNLGLH